MIDREDVDMEEFLPRPNQNDKMSSCTDNNNNRGQRRPARIAEKYGLRPRTVIRRLQLERSREDLSLGESKTPKNRPPPLSKYRRKTANARERHRMKEINDAFETLRRVLPDFCSRRAAAAMTKITTLKLAVNYIRALSHILEDGHPGDISFFDGLQMADVSIGRQLPPPASHTLSSHYSTHVVHLQSSTSSTSPSTSSNTSPALARGSLGSSSSSDLSDLLSDDSCVFEDTLDAFDDIPALPEADPFALLLAPEGEALPLES